MDQNKYIEVRIFEPVAEIPTSDTTREYSIKTLSTIHECDSLKHLRNNTQRNVPHPNVRSYSSAKQTDLLRNPERPLDIDLLLRYYACNSDMEKSINKVFRKMEDQVCKDVDQGPLIELGAVCRICDSLRDPSARKSSPLRFHDVLAKLQSLIRRCSREKLEQALSNDPCLKLCQHCGVISYSKSPSVLADPCRSPPKTSYFLSTQMFPDIVDNSDRQRIRPKTELATKRVDKYYNVQRAANRPLYKGRVDTGRAYGSREVSLTVKRENNFHVNNPRRVETMVAERENDNAIQETREILMGGMLESDEAGFESEIKNSLKHSDFKLNPRGTINNQQQLETVDLEDRDSQNPNLASDLPDRRFNRVDCKEKFMDHLPKDRLAYKWKKVSRDQLSIDCKEEVLRDILYEKPGPGLGPCASLNSVGSKQNQSTNVADDATSSANAMTYLAGRLESIDSGKKKSVSQPGGKSAHPGHPADSRSFVLHQARDRDAHLDSEFLMLEKLLPTDKVADRRQEMLCKLQHHSEHYKNVHPVNKRFRSFTCLVEDDSLENCVNAQLVQVNGSNTTVASSSSAENMIREWVKAPGTSIQEACKPLVSTQNLPRRKFWARKESVHGPETSNEAHLVLGDTTDSNISKPQKYRRPNKHTISGILSGGFKLWHSKDSINSTESKSKKTESRGNEKRFGKHLFASLKSIGSAKSKSKSNDKSSKSSGSSLSREVKDVARRIIYDESSLRNMPDKENLGNLEEVLLLYRKMLESTEQMDWQSFQRFVEDLHPDKRNLWRDICGVINDKVKRINEDDGSAEICIEITSVPAQGAERRTCSNEIVFEMDITLADMERYLGRLPSAKEQLDTLQRASRVELRNDDVCDTREASNQAE